MYHLIILTFVCIHETVMMIKKMYVSIIPQSFLTVFYNSTLPLPPFPGDYDSFLLKL